MTADEARYIASRACAAPWLEMIRAAIKDAAECGLYETDVDIRHVGPEIRRRIVARFRQDGFKVITPGADRLGIEWLPPKGADVDGPTPEMPL